MCDTDVNLCDICSLNEAEFDDQSMQCVIKEDSGLDRNTYIGERMQLKIGINFLFLVSLYTGIIVIAAVIIVTILVSSCILVIVLRRKKKKSEVYIDSQT